MASDHSAANANRALASPVHPELSIRPLRLPHDREEAHSAGAFEAVRTRLNQQLLQAPFSRALDEAALRANLLRPNPPSIHSVRWQGHQCFCAWRAGELVGLIDVAAGFDSDSLELPDYSPIGFLRFFLLPAQTEQIDAVMDRLFAAAEQFWRQQRVGYVKAFHSSMGYPEFQGGLGVLPGTWHEYIHILTSAGFQFTGRYYTLQRPLDHPLEEFIPLGQLSLVLRGKAADRHYQLYRQVDQIGRARVCELTQTADERTTRFANLIDLHIVPEWREKKIGRWLLRRLLNDALLQGYHQMLVQIPHRSFALQNLLAQHGFQEQDYRGYTLEKSLTN